MPAQWESIDSQLMCTISVKKLYIYMYSQKVCIIHSTYEKFQVHICPVSFLTNAALFPNRGECTVQYSTFVARNYGLCWNFRTIFGGQEPSRNRDVVPARQATQAGGIDSLESIPGLLKKFKIPSLFVSLVLQLPCVCFL